MIATVFFYQNYGAVIAVINTQFKNLFNMSRCRKQRERKTPESIQGDLKAICTANTYIIED